MAKNYIRSPHKKNTDASWSELNPILLDAEIILVDRDGRIRLKIGDGITPYNDLPFYSFGGGIGGGDTGLTWKYLKEKGITWKYLKDNGITWKYLKES